MWKKISGPSMLLRSIHGWGQIQDLERGVLIKSSA
jgi:hypothetical protein